MERKEKVELYVLLLTIAVGAVIAILDLTDSLDEIKWLSDRIPAITLLLLALVATSILMNAQSTRAILKSTLPVGSITKFENVNETFVYIVSRLKKAQHSVCDITYPFNKFNEPLSYSKDEYEQYLKAIEDVSKRIRYREIKFFSSTSTTDKPRRLFSTAGKYYQLSGYLDQPSDSPQRLIFVIIDNEVIFLDGLSIKQTEAVEYYRNYFERLWSDATPIKRGEKIYTDVLEKIEASVST